MTHPATHHGRPCASASLTHLSARLAVLLLALLALALAVGPGDAGAVEADPPHRPLRVLTYNLLHGGPLSGFTGGENHVERRLDLALAEIEALHPDVIALQEASRSRSYGDVAQRIADRLGYHVVFASAIDQLLRVPGLDWLITTILGFEEGVAVVSRYPIVETRVHRLPRCQHWYEPRIMLESHVLTPWGRLPVFSTHLSRNGCQSGEVASLVWASRAALPSLLMGDFNRANAKALTEQHDGAFLDVFRAANPDAPGLTVYQRIESEQPTVFTRVDYIFLVAGEEARGRVVSSRVVLDRPTRVSDGSVLWPSDHYGVLAEIELR